jgi:hypothetical protein
MIAVVLKDQLLHSNFLERKKMTKWYIKIIEDYSVPQFWTQRLSAEQIHKKNEFVTWSSEVTGVRLYLYSMEVVLKERCQSDIPRTTQCIDILKEIFQRGFLWLIGSQDLHRARASTPRDLCSLLFIYVASLPHSL